MFSQRDCLASVIKSVTEFNTNQRTELVLFSFVLVFLIYVNFKEFHFWIVDF